MRKGGIQHVYAIFPRNSIQFKSKHLSASNHVLFNHQLPVFEPLKREPAPKCHTNTWRERHVALQNVTQIHGAKGAALCTSAAAAFDTPRASPEGLGTLNAKPWLQN
jgi:hypothetical protein